MKWEETLAAYDKIAAEAGMERKGKTMPYTSANGYMFSLVNKDGELGIRLSKEAGEKFNKKYNTGTFHSHGAIMKDYVHIPEDMLGKTKTLAKMLKESQEYVMSLPPKPTNKKK